MSSSKPLAFVNHKTARCGPSYSYLCKIPLFVVSPRVQCTVETIPQTSANKLAFAAKDPLIVDDVLFAQSGLYSSIIAVWNVARIAGSP